MHTLTLTPPAKQKQITTIIIGDSLVETPLWGVSLSSFDRIVVLFDAGIGSIAKRIGTQFPSCIEISVPSGDSSKSLAEVERITSLMLDAGCTRKTLLVCVGGGMLTDLGGFVASVFMRGIACVLVPTSLLGMVDAAIGGKTAVNAGGRKNMIGSITHPTSVIVDTALLQALPEAQFSEGMVEVIKIAAIVDKPFFEWLEANMAAIISRASKELSECVQRAIEAKVCIVENDDHDRDQRLLLNFGHTVGHAVEALSKYSMSHGSAVSIGMMAEMRMRTFKQVDRVEALLEAINMPLMIPDSMPADALWASMLSDKKNEADTVRIAVPMMIGEGAVSAITQKDFSSLFA